MTISEPIPARLERALKSMATIASLVMMLIGAIVWGMQTYLRAESTLAQITALKPKIVAVSAQMTETLDRLDALEARIASLEPKITAAARALDRSPIVQFPGSRHRMSDTPVGGCGLVQWNPVRRLRDDCSPRRLTAFFDDRNGVSRSRPLSMEPRSLGLGDTIISYEICLPERVPPGAARVMVQVEYDCGTHVQIETTPQLPFLVIAPR